MINRHAYYLRDNDKFRAEIMADLLEKMGFPLNEVMRHEAMKNRNSEESP